MVHYQMISILRLIFTWNVWYEFKLKWYYNFTIKYNWVTDNKDIWVKYVKPGSSNGRPLTL